METRSLYVHIPFCESICSYCDFCKVYYDQKQSDLYLQRLNEELSQIEQHHLKTIYIGGGTPSALNDEQLEKLMSMLKPYSLEVEEYCMEVNPESMDYYKLKILKLLYPFEYLLLFVLVNHTSNQLRYYQNLFL